MREARRGGAADGAPVVSYVAYFLVWWVILYGIWFLLAGSAAIPEVIAGAGAAALSAGLALGIRVQRGQRYRIRLAWLPLLVSVPLQVLRDSARLGAVLWARVVRRRRVRGTYRLLSFPTGGQDPESAAWRAFVTTATSLTPNTIVIGFDLDAHIVLVHQLVPDSPRRLRRSVVGATRSRGGSL
jgi:multisubunit Na+/H+ antiporter MnhE subunit